MTLVIADTGPIHYLTLIDAVGIVPQMYDRMVIPSAVRDELTHPNSPAAVKKWMAPPPEWCEIRKAALVAKSPGLGPGEAEALALAEEIKADLILLDDRAARTEALRRGLLVTGTIGVLLDAAEHGLINLQDALDRLVRISFYIEPGLITEILARDAERQKLSPKQRGQLRP